MNFNVIVFIVLQVIVIDGILSLDNAAVLGAMAAKLSPHAPAPLAPWFRRMLGKNQQEAALKVGLLGAYIGRSLMLLLGGVIIAFPVLKVLGALYLLNLVAGHFEIYEKVDRYTGIFTFLGKIVAPIKTLPRQLGVKNNTGFLTSSLQRLVGSPFWRIVITVEIMDLVFSLDNVIAVLALSEDIAIIIFGVCISILIMRFAATQFLKLIDLEPLLVHAAYILILAIGVELILKYFNVDIGEFTQFGISVAIIIGFIVVGWLGRRLGWIQPAKVESQVESMTGSVQPAKFESQVKSSSAWMRPTTDKLAEPGSNRGHIPIKHGKEVLEGTRLGDTNTMPFTNTDLRW